MVAAIESFADFKALIEGDELVVVDFWATWCGPCKMISPLFEKLEAQFPALKFRKVDVDEQEDIAAEVGIKAMPTFMFFRKGEKVGQVVGADPNKLKAAITLQAETVEGESAKASE